MDPDGVKGFIPDGVRNFKGSPKWGAPYDFVEVKDWENMSVTGNLKQMIRYVQTYGGSIEVVFRAKKTKLSGPLKRELKDLGNSAKITWLK